MGVETVENSTVCSNFGPGMPFIDHHDSLVSILTEWKHCNRP